MIAPRRSRLPDGTARTPPEGSTLETKLKKSRPAGGTYNSRSKFPRIDAHIFYNEL